MQKIRLRPITDSDQSFLFHVFCSTHPDVMLASLEPDAMQELLQMQFLAQHYDYHRKWPDAQYSVVEMDRQPIGRLYIDRSKNEFRILDIALLEEYRGRGVGSQLVGALIDEARSVAKPVRIHVEVNSRQIAFYQRLGFQKIGGIPSHDLMEC